MSQFTLHPAGMKSQAPIFQALPPLSLYIHIPWCVRKCPYCDFNSHEVRGVFPEKEYVDALIRDLEMALPQIWGRKIYTVFFGGGTPSLLSGEGMTEILRHVRMLLPLDHNAEITLEANPGTVEVEKFAAFRNAGVNRLSIGVQSFSDQHLKALGRIHSGDEAKRSIGIAQQHFDNINLDLMYGLPQQTLAEALEDVKTALQFMPQHLSCYHLTLEPNTLFHHNPPPLPDDDASYEMQHQIERLLTGQGYEHYETSAFALPQRRAKHNLNYWQFGDYLGIGAGAHSKLSFHNKVLRQVRFKQPQEYIDAVVRREPLLEETTVPLGDIAFEFMMNALRLNEGFERILFQERTGLSLVSIRHELERAQKLGLLIQDHKKIAPTESGRNFLNDLLQVFLE
jgi:oxygen-independent coproporphyrinogen-3 oxidase